MSTPFDDLLLEASNGRAVSAEALASIKAPPGQDSEAWRAATLTHLAGIVAQYSAGERAVARNTAQVISDEYHAAFGKDGAPANPKPSDSVDESDPKALADLVTSKRNPLAVHSRF